MKRAVILLVVAAVCGCQTHDLRQKRANGAMVGSVVGAFVGGLAFGSGSGRLVTAALGAGLGAVGGFYVAEHLDQLHREQMQRAAYEALANRADGEGVRWAAAGAGPSGTFVPGRAFTDARGRHCREYRSIVTLDGEERIEARTACRLPTGAWETGIGPDLSA